MAADYDPQWVPARRAWWPFSTSCDDPSAASDGCAATPPSVIELGTILSLTPFLLTFAGVAALASRRLFPLLSRHATRSDGEGHVLPPSAPASLRQVHAAHGARSVRWRVVAIAFAATLGLVAVLAELILCEVAEWVDPRARGLALRVTVPTLLLLLVGVIPFLEVQSLVAAGWSFHRTSKGRIPRLPWLLQVTLFGAWLLLFWSLGKAVPSPPSPWDMGDMGGMLDATAMSLSRGFGSARGSGNEESLSRACLERIGVIGISLMALLSGFASVSSPWHTFTDRRLNRKRPVTEADLARKQAGLDATGEMLLTKRHQLRALQSKVAQTQAHKSTSGSVGLMGKVLGSLRGGDGDLAEIKALQMEIAGLETMETNLAANLSGLRARKDEAARAGTPVGRLLLLPTYAFSLYCVYRVLATSMTSLRRLYAPAATFSSTDPINRFLGLVARHVDPKLDQMAWARQISFLLSGVILAASANSVVMTFRLFAKWTPGLVHQAQANLALLVGQVAAVYVISAALLMRSNLPKEVGSAVGDVLESALEPGFVDRWFEGWFLVASAATAVGIWAGRKMGGAGGAGAGGGFDWEDWDELADAEMGQKRS